jgi:predicted metalloprotease with PDZ domain
MSTKISFSILAIFLSLSVTSALADSYCVEFRPSSLPDNLGQFRVANVEAEITPNRGIIGLMRSHRDTGLLNGWATFIHTFEAFDENGEALTPHYMGGGRWKLVGWEAGPVRLKYTMLLQHDRFPNDPGIDELAYARDYGVMWTGRALFMEGKESETEIDVTFSAPDSWRFTTPWRAASDNNRRFTAKDTDDLLNSAFMGGEHVEKIIEVAGNEARLALAPPLSSLEPVMTETLSSSLAEYENIFGAGMSDALLVILGDASFSGGGVMGRSISMVLGDDANNLPAYIAAHEGFHIWNVQWPYRQENGDLEWLKEGLAEYYTFVARVRTGSLSPEDFIDELARRAGVYLTALRQDSIAGGGARKLQDEASYNLVYSGGMMLCAALDAEIRKNSGGAKSLDDLMKTIHSQYAGSKDTPFTVDLLAQALEQDYAIDGGAFFEAYLYSDKPLPLREVFALYGLEAKISEGNDGVSVTLQKATESDGTNPHWTALTQSGN